MWVFLSLRKASRSTRTLPGAKSKKSHRIEQDQVHDIQHSHSDKDVADSHSLGNVIILS